MANTLAVLLRNSSFYCSKNLISYVGCSALGVHSVRHLYAPNVLGMDSFLAYKEKVKHQFVNIENKFIEKMKEFSAEDSKNMVFTEDLKNMIHLAKDDEDVDLVVKMMKKFNQQNSQLRFGNFVFGSVVMRMFHLLNKPDIAFELFKDPTLTNFFDQLITYQILLDLLYENQKYEEILEAFKIIQDKQVEGMKYPKNVVVLVYAALYKMNTKESWEYASQLWSEMQKYGHVPMRRAFTFCAGLALKQGHPEAALEIISLVRNQMYTSVRNIKALALAKIGRIDETLAILKSILSTDVPIKAHTVTFNRDVLEIIKNEVQKSDRQDLIVEFERLHKIFEAEGHISEITLDEQLCSEITGPSQSTYNQRIRQQQQARGRDQYFDNRRNNNKFTTIRQQRPGLSELQ